ncbi:MAG: 50S ribosomal protein L11 methyltransferase [Acidobacteria bacterium]|nr:50S ribosomal protein L11 methyltransferase [Acidobacteriota bacterium]
MSLVLDEHRAYLADAPRLDAFDAALRALVRPGDVVLDLASGTGILGLLACRAGARRVYAIEMGSIAELARDIARANGFGDRFVAIQEVSTRATLPERVDLIVMDGAGRFGFDGGVVETLSDARRRFLKTDGRIIPGAITLSIAPCDAAEPLEQIDFWARPVHGLSFAPASTIARSTGYPRHIAAHELAAVPADIATFDPSRQTAPFTARASCRIERTTVVRGIAGWFTAALAPGITLTNAPGAPNRIDRRNVFLPLRERVAVEPGDIVCTSLTIDPIAIMLRWRVEIASAQGGVRHATDASTFHGMLMSRDDLRRTRPDFVPVLTAAGRARKTILDLCDGSRPVADIEAEVERRHPSLFDTRAAVAVFVAEVLTRYAE